MEPYIFIAFVLGIVFYFVFVKNGNLGFWKKAAKHPDFIFEQMSKNDAWAFYDGKTKINKKEYDGPFLLHVPRLDKTLKIYGQIGKYKKSQKDIEYKMSLLDKIGSEY